MLWIIYPLWYYLHIFLLSSIRWISSPTFVPPSVVSIWLHRYHENSFTIFCVQPFNFSFQVCYCVLNSCMEQCAVGWVCNARVKTGLAYGTVTDKRLWRRQLGTSVRVACNINTHAREGGCMWCFWDFESGIDKIVYCTRLYDLTFSVTYRTWGR